MKKNIWKKRLGVLLFSGGFLFLASGLWIPAKALLAQVLLRHAWQKSICSYQKGEGRVVRPWPWADSWPVGRIRMERLGVDQIILEGGSGEALAFGPGHEESSGLPGTLQHVILYGHRDTSFSFLAKLQQGDVVVLEGRNGQQHNYQIENMEIVEASRLFLQKKGEGVASFITCYPFFQPVPGSTLRYLVTGRMVEKKKIGVR